MPTSTQTQLRRGTASQCDAMTPANGEPIVDTTNMRARLGNGSSTGGIIIPNAYDIQNSAFNTATAGGSANALTLTIAPVPAAYSSNMTVRFKAASNNTGAATINVNSLGNKTLKKSLSGSLADVAAGDLVSGVYYTATYDGTYFQVKVDVAAGLLSVKQGDLSTSTGSFSGAAGTMFANAGGTQFVAKGTTPITLPGGEYGFGVLCSNGGAGSSIFAGFEYSTNGGSSVSSVIPSAVTNNGASGVTCYGFQRYITSSPPFDMGDGQVGGFTFLQLDDIGDVVGHYAADVPPWAYNGPTKIRADRICPVTKKKFRTVMAERTLEEFMDGAAILFREEEITHDIKNRDMDLIPHPFGNLPAGHNVVMLDPMDDRVARLIELQNAGSNHLVEALAGKHIRVDNAECRRCGPPGVPVHRLKFKYSGQ